MQIHELNLFSGTPGENDYLAVDNGTDTAKVPATKLGVTTQMTQSEAASGTVIDPRVISPKVLHDSVESIMAQSPMTQAEAEAGTVTDPKTTSPKVFKDSVKAIMAQSPTTITLTATDGTTKTVTVVETT